MTPQFIVVPKLKFPGADGDEEKKEQAETERGISGRKKPEPALDCHAHRLEDHRGHKHWNGSPHSLAGHSLERMAGGNSLGLTFWGPGLGHFLWQYPDHQILASISR